MKNDCGIYEIECAKSAKKYIGSSADIDRRIKAHWSHLRAGSHANRKLQAAWNKHGADCFTWRKVLSCAPADLLMYEQRLIDGLRAVVTGFNLAESASSPMRGRNHSLSAKARISLAMTGRLISDESRAAMKAASILRADRVGIQMTEHWKTRSPSITIKIAASNTGKKRTAESRARIGAATKLKWELPDFRARGITSLERARMAASAPAVRAKMSAVAKLRAADPAERIRLATMNIGIKRSDETRAKMKASAIEREARKKRLKTESTQ